MQLDYKGLRDDLQAFQKEYGKGALAWLAEKTGLRDSTVGRIASGKTKPQLETWWKLHYAEPIRIRPPYIPTTTTTTTTTSTILSLENFTKESAHVKVPMAGQKVDGGTGRLLVDNEIISELAFRKDWLRRYGGPKDKIIFRVTGDSREKLIHEGDVVLIDQSESGKKVIDGEVYVVNDSDNGLVVKYVKKEPFGFMLKSENHDLYDPYNLYVEEG